MNTAIAVCAVAAFALAGYQAGYVAGARNSEHYAAVRMARVEREREFDRRYWEWSATVPAQIDAVCDGLVRNLMDHGIPVEEFLPETPHR